MKRSPLKRKTKLRSGSTPMRAKKKDPAKRRFAKLRCQEFLDWLKEQPCAVTGKRWRGWQLLTNGGPPAIWSGVDPAHIRTRGAGHPDLWNAIPLAHHLHDEQHRIGVKSFAKKYNLDYEKLATHYTDMFLAEHPECLPQETAQ